MVRRRPGRRAGAPRPAHRRGAARPGAHPGAGCRRPGRRAARGRHLRRTFYRPTVLANTPRDAAAYCEEVFGPVASVVSFATDDEAVELAAATDYGLSLGIVSRGCLRRPRDGPAHPHRHRPHQRPDRQRRGERPVRRRRRRPAPAHGTAAPRRTSTRSPRRAGSRCGASPGSTRCSPGTPAVAPR